MEAIILAGGFGTRLRPLTYTRAKPLLPILNTPMIGHIINKLPEEVDKIILAVNYKKNQIESYFKEFPIDKEIIINDEPEPLGTGGAVKFAEKEISDSFLVLNSDIICSLDLEKMIAFHRKNDSKTTISLWPVENVSEFGVADVKDDGKIVGFVEKPKPEDAPSKFINAGAYFLDTMILDYIETGRLVSMEKEIFPQIINDTGKFYGYKFDGYWMDIGRISSYLQVNRFLLAKNKINSKLGKNCKINGALDKCSIGNNVIVENKSKLKSTIVYDNVTIDEEVILKNCVIGENCKIGNNSSLSNVVVGDNESIKPNTVLNNEYVWTQPIPKNYPDKQIGNIIRK
jgi:mannose-1-phosphate guanylyltransferase